MPKLFVVDDPVVDPPVFVQRRGSSFVEENLLPGSYEVYNTRKMPGTVVVTKQENAPVTANPSLTVIQRGQQASINLANLVSGGVSPYSFALKDPVVGFSVAGSILTIDGTVTPVGTGSAVIVVTGANDQSNTITVNYRVEAAAAATFTPTESGFKVSNPGAFPDYRFVPTEDGFKLERV